MIWEAHFKLLDSSTLQCSRLGTTRKNLGLGIEACSEIGIGFSPCRYLHVPPRLLPTESDDCWVRFALTRKTRLSTAH